MVGNADTACKEGVAGEEPHFAKAARGCCKTTRAGGVAGGVEDFKRGIAESKDLVIV